MVQQLKQKYLASCCVWIIACLPVLSLAETPTAPDKSPDVSSEYPAEPTVTEETREREQGAEEDPLAQRQIDMVENLEDVIEEPDAFSLYGSIRIRHRTTEQTSFWGDGGSRVGVDGQWQYLPEYWLFGRAEAGFNILDKLDLLLDNGDRPPGAKFGDDVFLRLAYVGIETPEYMLVAGKNWSTYYRVTSFTDRFQGTGASASGTYNAGTDGGYTGTGRADSALQTRVIIDAFEDNEDFKPLSLNLQIQQDRPIPQIDNAHYKTSFGLSSVLHTNNNFSAGIAYNNAGIDEEDLPALKQYGIDGNATALALGMRWYDDEWYLGTVVSWLDNHETTDKLIYFDGTGMEIYGQKRLHKQWWGVGGWNYLKPDSSETQAGVFKINYYVLGVRYSFRKFSQMIFANIRFENSRLQDGTRPGNVYTIGVRWDLP